MTLGRKLDFAHLKCEIIREKINALIDLHPNVVGSVINNISVYFKQIGHKSYVIEESPRNKINRAKKSFMSYITKQFSHVSPKLTFLTQDIRQCIHFFVRGGALIKFIWTIWFISLSEGQDLDKLHVVMRCISAVRRSGGSAVAPWCAV